MKNNKFKPKHKPPSRIRYEKKNPVFSIRMPQEWHDQFKTLAEELGLSRREFMAAAIEKQKTNYERAHNQGYNKGHNIGHNAGYEKGKQDWRIWFFCRIYGKAIYITPNSDMHKDIIEYMRTRYESWVHPECIEKNSQNRY
jgi:flagellar biosynthesis/type III secretory pathway protein FliH